MSDVKEAAGAQAAAPVIRCFNGINSAQQKQVGGVSFTPDCNGAVNNTWFVEFINDAYSVYDKQTGNLVGNRVSDTAFWQAAGIADPSLIVDPRIVFIPDAGRNGQWLAVQINIGYRVLIATTNPNDPTADPRVGNWKGAAFDLPGNDFTMLGYDLNGVYIGVNNGGPSVPGDDRWPQIAFIPRAQALAWPPQLGGVKVTGPVPNNEYGDNLFPMIDRSGIGWNYATAIGVDMATNRRLTFSLISPQFGTILSHGTIDVPPFVPVSRGFRVKQPFGDSNVMFDQTGLAAAPTGGTGFDIWAAHTVLNQQNSCLAVRWYHLYIDPVTRMPGLVASGDIFQPSYDHFNPSILSLGKGDTTVVCLSRSGDYSTPQDPNNPACGNLGAYAAVVRENGSGGGTYTVVPLKAGQVGNYYTQGTAIRWGDYSAICPDPDPRFPRRVWAINQFVLQGGATTSQWCNAIASIDLT